jgi:hypothetical protein
MTDTKSEIRWLRNCESICYECAGTTMLRVMSDGVSLCIWCRIKEWFADMTSGDF